jgi:sugar/nucleoside kinase (ribokinase family)
MSVLVTGSIAIDNIKTPLEEHTNLLGGSASYAAIASSYRAPTSIVGIIGTDFPQQHLDTYKKHNLDLRGLERAEGKTFTWSGEYEWDMNNRRTLSVQLNVFEHFSPKLPEEYRHIPFILLGNIAPTLQMHVLNQLASPRFIVADTMDLWISTARNDLLALLKKIDMLILNDSEARELTAQTSLIKAGSAIRALGPRYVAIKKGEHGCLLFGEEGFFTAPAYPLEDVHDPTGAGDTFAGGVISHIASIGRTDFETLKQAVVHGSVMASFTVEAFSIHRLTNLTQQDIAERHEQFRLFSRFDDLP